MFVQALCSECKSAINNALSGRHKYWAQYAARQWLIGQSAWLAMDKREFKSERRTFLLLHWRRCYTSQCGQTRMSSLVGNEDIAFLQREVVNAKALSIMRSQDDINTEHNMKSICRVAVAHWTKRLTRNGQTRVQIREAHIFDITLVLKSFSNICRNTIK